jgi:transposase
MEQETVTLGRREQSRALVLNQVLAGGMTNGEAAVVLGVSVRQVKRLRTRYRQAGPAGLVHGNRGRRPWQAVAAEVATRVVTLAGGRYVGLNQQHLTEKLAAEEDIHLGRTTVRRILAGAGLTTPRPRRAPTARRRRERMAQPGMLLQGDGSRHRWLGPDGPELTLIAMIDDATSQVLGAVFREQEDGAGYLRVLEQIVRSHGIPQALYVDRHSIFQVNGRTPSTISEELAGGRAPTQVGRALGELGIRHIAAHSPQAKGRVERLWGTLQDRLVAELALAGVTTLAGANAFLADYLPRHNTRFAVPAADPTPAYLPVPADLNLTHVFCFKETRVVRADNTISYEGQPIQLLATPTRRGWARVRVEVQERLDGRRVIVYQGQEIPSRPAPPDAATARAQGTVPAFLPAREPDAAVAVRPVAAPPVRKPAAIHPWRRYRGVTKSVVS